MSDSCAVINDGYSRTAYVKARRHCYPAVRFRYRPVPLDAYNTISDALRDAKSGQAQAHWTVKTIAKYVEQWDVVDGKGTPVPLKVDALMTVDAVLLSTVFNITVGNRDTDEDPEWANADVAGNKELEALFGADSGPKDDLGNSSEG